MSDDATMNEEDWRRYVAALAALHRLELDPSRAAEVAVQMQRLHALARRFLDFPLPADIEPAPTFRP